MNLLDSVGERLMNVFMTNVFWWLICCCKSWLAIKVSVLRPLCPFAATKSWKVLSCFWFCYCFVEWCFHDCYILELLNCLIMAQRCFGLALSENRSCPIVVFRDSIANFSSKLYLAIVFSILGPLCSFTVGKRRKVLTCFRFCCCFVGWCFHAFKFNCCFKKIELHLEDDGVSVLLQYYV